MPQPMPLERQALLLLEQRALPQLEQRALLPPEQLALLPPERQAWQVQRVFPAGQALQRRVLPWLPAVAFQPLPFQSLAWQLALWPVRQGSWQQSYFLHSPAAVQGLAWHRPQGPPEPRVVPLHQSSAGSYP